MRRSSLYPSWNHRAKPLTTYWDGPSKGLDSAVLRKAMPYWSQLGQSQSGSDLTVVAVSTEGVLTDPEARSGGTVWIEGVLGEGSKYWIKLGGEVVRGKCVSMFPRSVVFRRTPGRVSTKPMREIKRWGHWVRNTKLCKCMPPQRGQSPCLPVTDFRDYHTLLVSQAWCGHSSPPHEALRTDFEIFYCEAEKQNNLILTREEPHSHFVTVWLESTCWSPPVH